MENTENVQATPQAEPRSDTAVGSKELLVLLKEEAAVMYREDRAKPLKEMTDLDLALRSDFCRYLTMLINRVEARISTNDEAHLRVGGKEA